tara:strand:+ start:188 stop:595 length:408 start_codon:yes stop_codon:yes gene_type:complete
MRLKDFIWMGGLLAGISFPLLAAEHEWPVYGGNDLHQRHSKLVQINKSNVTGLVEAWEFDTGINDTFQATPVVQDGVMYVSLPFNDVVALDAGNGSSYGVISMIWTRIILFAADRLIVGWPLPMAWYLPAPLMRD